MLFSEPLQNKWFVRQRMVVIAKPLPRVNGFVVCFLQCRKRVAGLHPELAFYGLGGRRGPGGPYGQAANGAQKRAALRAAPQLSNPTFMA